MNSAAVSTTSRLNPLLRMAVMNGVESAVRIHIGRGDDLNARDSGGMTALMLAAARNRAAICRLLLEAGADTGLPSPDGRTAYNIAGDAGSHEAEAVIREWTDRCHDTPDTTTPPQGLAATSSADDRADRQASWAVAPGMDETALLGVPADTPFTPLGAAPLDAPRGETAFDTSGWEAEPESPAPAADLNAYHDAVSVQTAISDHNPIDSSAAWDDIDVYLPEEALATIRTQDPETWTRLRQLLRRAVREGRVARTTVEALSASDDGKPNAEAESQLVMIINDLGAEVEDISDCIGVEEDESRGTETGESDEEEVLLDEALAVISSLATGRNEPLKMYMRVLQRQPLISAPEEVTLGQVMEASLETALDALASWPHGVRWLLAAGNEVRAGARLPGWMNAGDGDAEGDPDPDTLEDTADAPGHLDAVLPNEDQHPADDAAPDRSDHPLPEAFNRLAELDTAPSWREHEIRQALADLRLRPAFLLELADVLGIDRQEPAMRYVHSMHAYRQARERMALANLRLVFSLARKYAYGETLDDLVQAGNIGLLRAVERYDWRRGFKFSTYATWWIRQAITRHVADSVRTIRIPVHVHEKLQRLYRITRQLESATGRPPELGEIADAMGMPVDRVGALQRLPSEPLSMHDLSIDELIAVEERDIMASPDPEEITFRIELSRAIESLLSGLTDKEAQILRLRCGIGVSDALTLEEVGQRYAVTRERVRQIEAKALRKLRTPGRIEYMRSALGVPDRKAGRPPASGTAKAAHPRTAQPADGQRKKRTSHSSGEDDSNGSAPPRLPALDRILLQASEQGVTTEDDRSGRSGRVWVNLADPSDIRYRRLARMLTRFGFQFWAGKGFWI